MIYKREEFIQEDTGSEKFPVKTVEQMTAIEGDEAPRFVGRVTMALQTPMGMSSLPINFELEAATIQEAFELFEAKANTEIEAAKAELQEQLQEARRRQQSQIVTLDQLGGGMGGMGGGGGSILAP